MEEQVGETVSPLQTAQEDIPTKQAMGESEETQSPSSPALRWSTRLRRPPESTEQLSASEILTPSWRTKCEDTLLFRGE